MNNIERRTLDSGVALRQGGDARKIGGHAAVFNDEVEIWPGFRERFLPGAFTRTIGEDDIRALWNHDSAFVMGRLKSGTLKLSEDDRGLVFENDPPDAQWARDVVASIERGDISGASIGFRAMDEEWERKDGVEIRTITRAKLFDVSPVAFPAYPQTDVGVRALLECSPSLPDELRDELTRALGETSGALLEGADMGATIGKALDSHVEAIAVRVAEILIEKRAAELAVINLRGKRQDLSELEPDPRS